MYSILKGIGSLAEADNLAWASVVCTLPAAMHPNPKFGKNSWDGTLPDEAWRDIGQLFGRLRAGLAKKGIKLAGLKTAESHQDGCPHANFFVVFDEHEKIEVEAAFNQYFGHGPKSIKFTIGKKGADSAKFASYCLKYFTKFFDGSDDEASVGEQAWASAWKIRRYAFFGIPPLTQWRLLRSSEIAPVDHLLQKMWRAARGGRAALWIALCGGMAVKNKTRPTKTYSEKHLKSRVATGVENLLTDSIIVIKKIGYWILETTEKSRVTVNLSCPSASQSQSQNLKIQPQNYGFGLLGVPILAPPCPF